VKLKSFGESCDTPIQRPVIERESGCKVTSTIEQPNSQLSDDDCEKIFSILEDFKKQVRSFEFILQHAYAHYGKLSVAILIGFDVILSPFKGHLGFTICLDYFTYVDQCLDDDLDFASRSALVFKDP
jgi:hypothetical protein